MEPLPILRPIRIPKLPRIKVFNPRQHPIKAIPNNPVDVAVDWIYLPSTAEFRLPFSVNNQQGGTRYVQTELSSPPAGWSDSPRNHGSVGNGYTLSANHLANRTTPSFTDGEYDETLTLAIRLFKDSSYSELDVELTVEYAFHHFKSDDPAWNVLAFHDFESDTENWVWTPKDWAWNASATINRGSPGYGSSYSIYRAPNPGCVGSLNAIKIYDASFDDPSTAKSDTVNETFLDGSFGDVPDDTWIAAFGYMSDLTKARIGLVIIVDTCDYCYSRKNGYSTPSASKVYWSLVARHISYWYVDRVRIVYK